MKHAMIEETPDDIETPFDQLRAGMTRDEVQAILGPFDAWGGTSRKYRTPIIYKYDRHDEWEFTFEHWKAGGLIDITKDHGETKYPLKEA